MTNISKDKTARVQVDPTENKELTTAGNLANELRSRFREVQSTKDISKHKPRNSN